ncbi:unnamed protein product [Closterium sp. NIES-64]|nr:unnamed protein product [Closterium sp. NIES-64]
MVSGDFSNIGWQWHHVVLAVAPRGAGSGATWCWQWRHVVLAVVPRGAGSGATWCWQWRHVVLAVAPRGAGSGATWCWQWRHVVLAVAHMVLLAQEALLLHHFQRHSLMLPIPLSHSPHPPVHGEEGQRRMREAGQLAARVRDHAGTLVKPGVTTDEIDCVAHDMIPGVTTDEIDRAVHEMIIEAGAYPSPLNYAGFPKSVCTSVNECICHGIPDSRPLEDGDIINIDVTDGDIINIDVTVYLNVSSPPSPLLNPLSLSHKRLPTPLSNRSAFPLRHSLPLSLYNPSPFPFALFPTSHSSSRALTHPTLSLSL